MIQSASISLDKSIPVVIHLELQVHPEELPKDQVPDLLSNQVNMIPSKGASSIFSNSQLDTLISPTPKPSLGNIEAFENLISQFHGVVTKKKDQQLEEEESEEDRLLKKVERKTYKEKREATNKEKKSMPTFFNQKHFRRK